MPSSIQKMFLDFREEFVPLNEIFPTNSIKLLEDLYIGMDCEITDPSVIQDLCLNGKLKRLNISSSASKAFSEGALWLAAPQTLQDLTLHVPPDKGIPRILEELLRLTAGIGAEPQYSRTCAPRPAFGPISGHAAAGKAGAQPL